MVALSLTRLNSLCGSATVSRGRVYYEAGRVVSFTWEPGSDVIHGSVVGSKHQRYNTWVYLGKRNDFTGGDCTCPVASNCKHVVATVLAAAGAPREFSIATPPKIPAWRQTLDGMLARAEGSAAVRRGSLSAPDVATPPTDFDQLTAKTQLGLQFRVDGLVKDAARRSAIGNIGRAALAISVRPVQYKPSTKKWSGGAWELTWDVLRRHHGGDDFDPTIREWFAEVAAMRPQGVWGATEWVELAEIPGRLLWPQLARAVQLGIPFLANSTRDTIVLANRAELHLDVKRSDDEVTMAPRLLFDGEHAPVKLKGLIGEHGVFAVAEPGTVPRVGENEDAGANVGWQVTLGPLDGPLNPSAIHLLDFGTDDGVLTVPAEYSLNLVKEYLPQIRKHLPLVSSDDSFALPEKHEPTLIVTATFVNPTTAQLSVHWEYQSSDNEVTRFALNDAATALIRDTAAEVRVWRELTQVLMNAGLNSLPVHGDLAFSGFDAMKLAEEILPLIAQVNRVEVVTIGTPSFAELTEQPIIELAATDSTDADWFNLAVTIKVAEKEVPLPNVLEALAKGKQKLMLVDGSWLRLNHPSLEPLRNLLAEADRVSDKRGQLRVSRHQVALWDELAELADVVEQSENWKKSVGGLLQLLRQLEQPTPRHPAATPEGWGAQDLETAEQGAGSSHSAQGTPVTRTQNPAPPVPVPPEITPTLRPYQTAGFQWLAFCWQYGLGGILADDMGLGKTLQTLALIQHAKNTQPDSPPFLVVAPASVVSNWQTEAAKFAPELKVVVIPKTLGNPVLFQKAIAGADVVVTSYAIFRLGEARFREAEWSGLILDEAQFVKNRATKANQAARKLKAPFKLAITGTPLENNIDELWAILAVVAPGLFPTYERFREDFSRPVDAMHKPEVDERITEYAKQRLELLRRRVKPLVLRRTKQQVAPELPPRIEQVINVELDPAHRRAYDIYLARERKRVLGLLEDYEANKVAVFRALTTLRRAALDVSLIDEQEHIGVPSSKIDVLFDQLESIIAEGHRVLVFSQFTSYLSLVAQRANAENIDFAYLDGATRNRPQVINQFREGTAPLFLISLKAGGFGLNLTEADYVFLLDPWWNPAVEAQAIDRTHRIGQNKSVMVTRLVSENTIEEKVMALKSRKAALVGAVLRDDLRDDDAATTTGLTAEDIKSLLS